jgi:uncharacterized protein YqeY
LQDYVAKEKKMSVIEKLKTESLALRKTKNPVAASIVFALSEIEKFGKNNGNRATTEDEAIKIIQKLIATIDENLKAVKDTGDHGRAVHFNFEKNILLNVLPQMASDDEVRELLKEILGDETPKNKGVAMKVIRDQYGAKVDMKRAGEIVTEIYGI